MVLPRALSEMVDLGRGGWPVCLAMPEGCGINDPAAGLWHGSDAANEPFDDQPS
jgi:hypothetical protein